MSWQARLRTFVPRLIDPSIALTLSLGYLALLLGTVKDLGYARDEGFYFNAARSYSEWFALFVKDRHAALVQRTLDAYWSQNAEHPALMKLLFGLSNLYLQTRHHLFSMDGTSFRFPAMVVSSAMIGVLYLWARRLSGRAAGLVAAVTVAFLPRFFFHAHLACFDAPITAFFTFTTFAYVKALRSKSLGWSLLTGLLFGLSLDTKHNAWFIPIAAVVHLVLVAVFAAITRASIWSATKRILLNLGAMTVIGPLVVYALWPWLWHDTSARLHAYANFHLHHEYYNMEFLGENYWEPPMPRGYAWLMTLATVPTISICLGALGFFTKLATLVKAAARRNPALIEHAVEWIFIGLCMGVSYGPWLSNSTPIFGGTKHWMPAYPFLCLFVGFGFARAHRGLVSLVARRPAFTAVRFPLRGLVLGSVFAIAAVAAPIREAVHAHPFGLTAYTPLVGGAPGAATLGLNRTFWGYATGSVAPLLNKDVAKNGSIYVHDTAPPSWKMLVDDGRIRKDIRMVGSVDQADVALYHHELHMEGQEYQAWTAFGTDAPREIEGLDGVPVIMVYQRPP